MELLSSASPESFHGSECFTFQDSDDSGLSSSPSSPRTAGDDVLADVFNLDPTFCGALNESLFDGEFPSTPYTHIKIKDDDEGDDELWFNTSPPKSNSRISSSTDSYNSPSHDYFDESFELIAELFNPKFQVGEKVTEQPCSRQRDITNEPEDDVINVESTNSDAFLPSSSTESGEESKVNDACCTIISNDTSAARERRTRRKRIRVDRDHDYCKQETVLDDAIDSDEDYKVEQDNEDSDDIDDEDYKAPCSAKNARKANSKTVKDAKYWERRQRNNLAAKRSREAKRAREINVAKKTAALEKENVNLKKQVRKLKADIKKAEKMLRIMV